MLNVQQKEYVIVIQVNVNVFQDMKVKHVHVQHVQMIVQVMVVARISPVLVMRVGWARIVLLRLV